VICREVKRVLNIFLRESGKRRVHFDLEHARSLSDRLNRCVFDLLIKWIGLDEVALLALHGIQFVL
jgi:hypothetical protein